MCYRKSSAWPKEVRGMHTFACIWLCAGVLLNSIKPNGTLRLLAGKLVLASPAKVGPNLVRLHHGSIKWRHDLVSLAP